MTEQCYECDGNAVLVRGPREVRAGTRVVKVEAEFMRCESCGEEYYLPGQVRELERTATGVIRAEDGLLSPREIEGIRAQYGLSQAAFEQLINAGPKTVTRWERGTVAQNGTADTLMRVLRNHPEVAQALAVQRRIVLPRSPATQSQPAAFFAGYGSVPGMASMYSTQRVPVRSVAEACQFHPRGGTLQDVIGDFSAVPNFEGGPRMQVGVRFRQKVGT